MSSRFGEAVNEILEDARHELEDLRGTSDARASIRARITAGKRNADAYLWGDVKHLSAIDTPMFAALLVAVGPNDFALTERGSSLIAALEEESGEREFENYADVLGNEIVRVSDRLTGVFGRLLAAGFVEEKLVTVMLCALTLIFADRE